MTLSLRTRLGLFYTAVVALLLTALSVAAYRALARQLDADATADLVELTSGLRGYLRIDDGHLVLDFDRDDPAQVEFVTRATRYYQVYDAHTGNLLAQSDDLEPLGVRFTPAEVREILDRPRVRDIATERGRLRLANSFVPSTPGEAYLLQVGISLDPMDDALSRFLRLLLWGVPAGLFVAVLGGRWMAGFALAPLSRVAAVARTIGVTNLTTRLPVRGVGDELDAVAEAFNEALVRLEHAVGEMRQFSTALAHELRTPLAALRGEIELAWRRTGPGGTERRSLESQLEEVDRLKRLIDQLLTLARAEVGDLPLGRDPVDLGSLATTVVDQLESVAQARDVALRAEVTEAVPVDHADEEWLRRLLLNLIDNALAFTPPGGHVTVRVAPHDRWAVLEVRDTGIGMTADVVAHAFEPFYQANNGSPPRPAAGAGVGLALVKRIAERHHGLVEVASEPGRGSTFTVRLPLGAAGFHAASRGSRRHFLPRSG